MMTEKEAETKICPAMLSGNQNTRPRCCASGCMAWRWGDPVPLPAASPGWWPKEGDVSVLRSGEPARPDDVPADAVWVPVDDAPEDECDGGYWELPADVIAAINSENLTKRRGFCGLSGKPGVT